MKQALPPNSPVELVPWKQIMALSLAALCLPFGLALLWEFRSQRVAGVAQIQDSMNLPILAEVTCLPRYPRLTNRQATIAYDSQRAAFENSIHYLCRSLLLSAEQSRQSHLRGHQCGERRRQDQPGQRAIHQHGAGCPRIRSAD